MKKALEKLRPYQQGRTSIDGVEQPLKLSANESPYGPSPKALQAYQDVVADLNRYPDGGQFILRDAVSEIYGVPVENIIASNGSDEGISMLMRALLEDGDDIIVSENGFVMTDIHAMSCGANVIKASEQDYKVHIDSVLNAVTDKTKVVAICNPNNPTGTYISKSEIARLEKNLPKHIILMLDAAYAEYVDKDDFDSGLELFRPDGRVVVTRTFSKAYGLPSLRVGWMAVPDSVADAIHRIRTPFNVNLVAMVTAAAATLDVDYTRDVVKKNNYVRDEFSKFIGQLGLQVIPSVTNFVLFKFPDGDKDGTGANQFLLNNGVIPRPAGGSDKYLRISIGTESEMKHVYRLLKDYMEQ